MKSIATTIPILAIFALLFSTPRAQAQFGAPDKIDYQGYVTDDNDPPMPLGTPNPKNYTMEFRIWDQQSGGNVVWAESQVVTVDNGNFSVRLGEGIEIAESEGGAPAGPLSSAFESKERFLGLTVNTTDFPDAAEITPRLAFLSSPFSLVAERAALADKAFEADTATTAEKAFDIEQQPGTTIILSKATIADATINNFTLADMGIGKLYSGSALEFGAVLGEAANSGTIKYNNDALEISGWGTTTNTQRINLFAKGGLVIDGPVNASGPVIATLFSGSFSGNGGGLTNLNAAALTGTLNPALLPAVAVTDDVNDFSAKQKISADLEVTAKVGIGIQTPVAKLDVNGSGWFRPDTAGVLAEKGLRVYSADLGNGVKGYIQAFDYGASNSPLDLILEKNGGKVGIGTSSPVAPLHVAVSNSHDTGGWYFGGPGIAGGTFGSLATINVSIKADDNVEALGFFATSDARIKDIVRRADSRADLETVQKLQVTDYRLKDRAMHGDALQKGFIAQEVQALIPEAVNKGTAFIPDLYAVAEILEFAGQAETLSLRLEKGHGLKQGDMVRLITDDGAREHTVTEIQDENTFLVSGFTAAPKRVFAFGRQVDDFLSVDYNRIFTMGISAIQQLKQEKDEENRALMEENAKLTRQLSAVEKRLAALEAQVIRLATVAEEAETKTVSVR